jgi:hypothetical protein
MNASIPRSVDLPSASAVVAGRLYIIKDGSGTALDYPITVIPDGADTIEGIASAIIDSNNAALMIISDGVSNWQII